MRACTECGIEGKLADFEFSDALCKPCRKKAGPRKRRAYNPREVLVPVPPKRPKPSGRRARAHKAREKVSAL